MRGYKFGLKNFRVFNDQGVDFDIAPITIITGQNSSGKSSMFKSLMLLNNTLSNLGENYISEGRNYNPLELKLNFHEGRHNLGLYSTVVNRNSESEFIDLSYTVFSEFLQAPVTVEMTYGLDKDDFLRRARLLKIEASLNGDLLFKMKMNYEDESVDYEVRAEKYLESFQEFIQIKEKQYDPIKEMLSEGVNTIDDRKGYLDIENLIRHRQLSENEVKDLGKILRMYEKYSKMDSVDELFHIHRDLKVDKSLPLFYLPLDEYFDKYRKENIKEGFNKLILDKLDTKVLSEEEFKFSLNVINFILDLYIKSDVDKLSDLFRSLESDFLKSYYKDNLQSTMLMIYSKNRRGSNNSIVDYSIARFSMAYAPNGNFMNIHDDLGTSYLAKEMLETKKMNFEVVFRAFLDLFIKLEHEFHENRYGWLENFYGAGAPYYEYYKPIEFELFNMFVSAILQESLIQVPSFITNNTFIDAIRANTQRMYTFKTQGTGFNQLMVSYLGEKEKQGKNSDYKLGEFTREWMQRFEIGDDIHFDLTDDGLGVHIYIIRGDKRTLLADEGYGITQLLSIFLHIELHAVKASYRYGHPFLLDIETKAKESTISIEEPESNLHPKFQSLLAEMFMDAYKRFNIRFMLETHSEYLIRKLQTLVAKEEITSDDVAIHYIHHYDKEKRPDGAKHVEKIEILSDGRLNKAFGTGFFDEADNLALDLLTMKSLN